MRSRRWTRVAAPAVALGAALLFSTAASAQAVRTWVSGVGDDANPCSRIAPCRTFAGAISKTAAGGEINCLDPGAYGAVTITKALSIICEYTEAGILASGSAGVIVAAGTADSVYLSGLDIHGASSATHGIRVVSAATVHIHHSKIRNFNATNGRGVQIVPTGNVQVTISDSSISNNGNGGTGSGIHVQPVGAGTARLTMRSVLLHHNANANLSLDSTGASGVSPITAAIDESQFIGSTNGISLNAVPGTNVQVMLTDSVIALNAGAGILATGGGTRVRAANNSITANGTGISTASGANVNSYGTNRLDGNGTDGAFTGTVLPSK